LRGAWRDSNGQRRVAAVDGNVRHAPAEYVLHQKARSGDRAATRSGGRDCETGSSGLEPAAWFTSNAESAAIQQRSDGLRGIHARLPSEFAERSVHAGRGRATFV